MYQSTNADIDNIKLTSQLFENIKNDQVLYCSLEASPLGDCKTYCYNLVKEHINDPNNVWGNKLYIYLLKEFTRGI